MPRFPILGKLSLNPCCNGRGSKTATVNAAQTASANVLILVVMEEGQRRIAMLRDGQKIPRLNPCCNGRGSKTL